MAKIVYNDEYSYEIFDDGYDIYYNDKRFITQRDPLSKLFVPNGTYEENALAHLEEITHPAPPEPTPIDKVQANLDYLALMMDVELPVEPEV